jgi:hypothetical protein
MYDMCDAHFCICVNLEVVSLEVKIQDFDQNVPIMEKCCPAIVKQEI